MKIPKFNPQSYWQERLAKNPTLQGTGHRAFNLQYNQWLYRAQKDCLDTLLQTQRIALAQQQVLDVGSGTGFFVEYYQKLGAQVTGLDIAESSIEYLQQHYPTASFYAADVSVLPLPMNQTFHLISIISVLYHIVDDARFAQAINNLIGLLAPGGYLILSDTLTGSFLPSGKHARFRAISDYESIFKPQGMHILNISPIYYWLNRTFVPLLGPKIINTFNLGERFYHWDTALRAQSRANGSGMKLLLAQKTGAA